MHMSAGGEILEWKHAVAEILLTVKCDNEVTEHVLHFYFAHFGTKVHHLTFKCDNLIL